MVSISECVCLCVFLYLLSVCVHTCMCTRTLKVPREAWVKNSECQVSENRIVIQNETDSERESAPAIHQSISHGSLH